MGLKENVDTASKIFDFFGITKEDVSTVNFVLISIIIAFFVKKLYNWRVRSKGELECKDISGTVAKVSELKDQFVEFESIMHEIKTESDTSHAQLRSDLDRFDRYMEDLQRNTFELHGMIVGSFQPSSDPSFRRIIHNEN